MSPCLLRARTCLQCSQYGSGDRATDAVVTGPADQVLLVGRKQDYDEFMRAHADARPALSTWLSHVGAATGAVRSTILERYPRASVIRDGLVVFDIKGNDYRLAARIDFDNSIVRVLKVGTHADYDRWSL